MTKRIRMNERKLALALHLDVAPSEITEYASDTRMFQHKGDAYRVDGKSIRKIERPKGGAK